MNKSLKIVMGVCLVLLLLFSFLVYSFFRGLAPSPNSNEDEILLKSSSPDGRYAVEMHRQNGGATVDFAVLGKLFIGNSTESKDFYWSYHESEAKVEWVDNSTVVINGKRIVLPDGEYDWRKVKTEPIITETEEATSAGWIEARQILSASPIYKDWIQEMKKNRLHNVEAVAPICKGSNGEYLFDAREHTGTLAAEHTVYVVNVKTKTVIDDWRRGSCS